jgi:hypothetical protein
MEACLLVTASVAVLTGLVGLAHKLLPRWRKRPPQQRLRGLEDVSLVARGRITR